MSKKAFEGSFGGCCRERSDASPVKTGASDHVPEKAFLTSRGYQKLADAARAFHFDFRGKVVLDIGSSTGGFTQYALDHGAKKVIAVEKGTNQMVKPLRYDPCVDLHEKTDIFDVKASKKPFEGSFGGCCRERSEVDAGSVKTGASDHVPEKSFLIPFPDAIIADVSFLSLTKILKYAKINLARRDTDYLVMLKPQFEANPSQLHRGIIKNEKIRREIIKNFEQWLKSNGFVIVNKRDNALPGKTGNIERFYWLKLSK